MFSSREAVKCTVRDGAVCMLLDNVPVDIPFSICSQSKVLADAVSSVTDPSATDEFTLAAPHEWLQAWVEFYCKKEKAPVCSSVKCLVNRLMVCFCSGKVPVIVLATASLSAQAFSLFTINTMLISALQRKQRFSLRLACLSCS
jgi:hypothetical protein